MDISTLVITTCIWAGGAYFWWRQCYHHLSSPLFIYLVFHLLGFVIRPWFVYLTHNDLYLEQQIGLMPNATDYWSALWAANIGLVMMLFGGWLGEAFATSQRPPRRTHRLNPQVIFPVGTVLLMLAILSYVRYGVTPWGGTANRAATSTLAVTSQGYRTAITTSTSYVTNFYVLVASVFVVWIAACGFRKWYALFLGPYFFLIMYGGFGRTTYLIGGLALVFASLGALGRNWPSKKAILVLVALIVAFAAGKGWAQALVATGPMAAIDAAQRSFAKYGQGQGALFINYDMLTVVINLVPSSVSHTYFNLYGRALYFWIPRAIWPSKPVFDFPAAYLGVHRPDLNLLGIAVTLVGESYLAFGIIGIFLLMFCYGFFFALVHRRLFRHPSDSVERILGIALSASLVQVYRDGIISLPLFVLYYFGPCAIMWFIGTLIGAGPERAIVKSVEQGGDWALNSAPPASTRPARKMRTVKEIATEYLPEINGQGRR